MLETLFFQCYYAYLQGNLQKAQMFYSLIRDEFKTSGNPDSLKKHQLYDLKKIKDAIETGKISRSNWLEDVPQGPTSSPDVEIMQPELVKKIHTEGLDQLKEILDDDIHLYNIEHPCGSYGAVDMVYIGKTTIYPLEVKRATGGHDLIGQISKYDLYHRLQLHYKHYEHVQSITLCNSYLPFALKELKSMGVRTLNYALNKEGIKIGELA